MADKQAQAMERLLTKLSVVRKTLRGTERQLLDSMVLASQAEVTPHAAKTARIDKKAAGEVEMHSANVRRADAGAKDEKASARNTMGASADAKASQPNSRWNLRVNVKDGNYTLIVTTQRFPARDML
jgi:hypothetical protein